MPSADRGRVWKWNVDATFNPRYDATATAEGVRYGCEIQGPFCGYDSHGEQSWEQFLSTGPPADVPMPAAIAAEIRAYGLARTRR